MTTIIKTFSDDIYIISGKTPDEVAKAIEGMDEVRMPNGSYIHRKSIASMQSQDDYNFQAEQKVKHKRGQYLKNNEWHDLQGGTGVKAHLERITGELEKRLPAGSKQIKNG